MRTFLMVAMMATLSACGFQLRGAQTLPYETMYINLSEITDLGAALRRGVRASGKTQLVESPTQAQALLTVSETREKNILSLSGTGKVREYQLVYNGNFRLSGAKGEMLYPETSIRLTREITFDDTRVLAKDYEEALLYRDMQTDFAQQVMRRLAAGAPPQSQG